MTVTTPTEQAGDSHGRWRSISLAGRDRAAGAFAGIVALTVLPVVAAALSLVGRHWHPASDLALELLQIDDVGGRHTPLTGVHSRYGWDHPGPLLLWLLAPFDWVFGTTGVLVGVAVLNVAAMVGALVVARRRGGITLAAIVAALLLVLTLANDTDLFVNPWNPWVAVLPFFTYVLLAWSLADDDIGVLPWLVGVGTFIVQAHVGYAPLVLGAGLVAAALGWHARRTTRDVTTRRRDRRVVVLAAAVATVLWLPPIVQQLSSGTGNLAAIVEFFRHPPEARAGWGAAWGIMGTELGPPGAWLAGDELGMFGVLPSATLPAVGMIVLTAVLGALASHRGGHSAGRLALLVVALCGFGIVATSRITGIIGTYLVRWWWVLAAVVWLSIVWSVASALAAPARRVLLGLAVAATAVLSVVVTVRAVPARLPDSTHSTVVDALADDLEPALARDATYVVDWTDAELWGAVGAGVFAELARRGHDVAVLPARAPMFGSWRTATVEDVDGQVLVVGSTDAANGVVPPPGWVEVARFDATDGEDYAVYLDRS